MKIAYRADLRLSADNKRRLLLINKIIEDYARQGFKLTLRQLYYQLVSRDVIPNKVSEYAKLGTLLVKGRMAGVVDWDAIEDRIRKPYLPYWVLGVEDALNDTVGHYRLNRMDGQDVYIECWVEKDALSGVLRRVTSKYHINLMVNRGYSSASAMHDAYLRFQEQVRLGKKVVILYLGDHDASGLDMIRDIRERLEEFGLNHFSLDERDYFENNAGDTSVVEADFMIKQIGLTMEQIKEFNPPPNPAKITDPRAKWYIEQFGRVSWEVDALNPDTLLSLVRDEVEDIIDLDLFNEKLEQEEKDKRSIKKIASEYEGDE